MAKRLNKNLVVVLSMLAFVVVIIASYVWLRGLQPRDPQKSADLAKQSAERGEWEASVQYFLRAASISGDAMYLVQAGDVSLQAGNLDHAHSFWREAIVQQPDLIAARERLVQLLLDIAKLRNTPNDWIALQKEAEDLLALSEDHPAATHGLAMALINAREQEADNLERGVEALRRAVQLSPDSIDFTVDLAGYLRSEDLEDEAEQLYQDLIPRYPTAGPHAARCRWIYAGFLAATDRFDEAERLYDEAMRMAGEDAESLSEVKLRIGVYHMDRLSALPDTAEASAQREVVFARARRLLEESVAAAPESYEPYIRLAALLLTARQYDEALRVCDDRLDRPMTGVGIEEFHVREYKYRLTLLASDVCLAAVSAADDTERNEFLGKARDYIDDARSDIPGGAMGSLQQGRLLIEMGRLREALGYLQSADDSYNDRGVIHWGNKTLLAELHLNLNEPGAAKALLDEVAGLAEEKRADNSIYWALYARAYLDTNHTEDAIRLADRALAIDPNNEAAANVKFVALQKLGLLDEAKEISRQVAGAEATTVLLEFRSLLAGGDEIGAYAALKEYLDAHPADLGVLRDAVIHLLRRDRRDEAVTLVERAIEREPDSRELKALALNVRPAGSPQQQDKLIVELIESDPDPLARALRFARYHDRSGDHDDALTALGDAERELTAQTEALGDSAVLVYRKMILSGKLLVAVKMSDWDLARSVVEQARRINADGAGGRVFLGRYHMFHDEPSQALGAFREVLASQKTNANILALAGNCCQLLGQYEDAKDYYEQAVTSNPNHGPAYRGLAFVALTAGDLEAYVQHLGQCRRLIPADPWVKRQLLYLQDRQNPQQAIERRETLLVENPDDADNLLNLAKLCALAGRIEKADTYYDRVLGVRSNDQALVFEVSEHYRITDRNDRAQSIIQEYVEAQTSAEAAANARVVLAGHYQRRGELEKARSTLLEAAELAETFEICLSLADYLYVTADDPHGALLWYNKAVESGRAGGKVRLRQAHLRRIGCVLHPRMSDTALAGELVEEFRRDYPDSPAVAYALSEVQAQQGRVEDAVDTLTRFLEDMPNDAAALYRKAELLVQLGRWAAAAEELETLKAKNPAFLQLRPRVLLSRAYENTGRADLALAELETLNRQYPNSTLAAAELVKACTRAGRLNDADRVTTAQINRRTGAAAAPWYLFRADIDVMRGDKAKALDDLKRAAELTDHSPVSVVRFLNLCARLGRADEGLEYYESHAAGKEQPASLMAGYGSLLVQAGRTDDAVAQFRSAMMKAIDESYRSVTEVGRIIVAALPADVLTARFDRSKDNMPPDPVDERIMAAHFDARGQWRDAVERLERLVGNEDDPQRRFALRLQQAVIFQLHEDPSRAGQCYEEALQINDQDAIALNNYADLLSTHFGEHQRALEYARKAVSLSQNPDLRDTLGWIYVALERYPEAVAQLSSAVRLDPDRALFLYHLGEAYRRAGRLDQARSVLRAGMRSAKRTGDEEMAGRLEESLARLDQGS